MKTASEVQMIGTRIKLPMIVSVLIMSDNGLAPINHVMGLYKGMIIDGENDTAQVFNEKISTRFVVTMFDSVEL